MSELWRKMILDGLTEVIAKTARLLPNLLAMATLVGLGLVIGVVLKFLLLRVFRAVDFDVRCQRWGLSSALTRTGLRRPPSRLLGSFLFWIVVFFFSLAALEALNLPTAANVLSLFFRYLPHAVAAGLILLGGWLLANFLGRAALIAAANAEFRGARVLSFGVRWAVMVMAASMALTQLGIGREVVVAAFSIVFGGVTLAFAIAFGLGGKELAKEFLERRFRELDETSDTISHL